MNNARDGPQPKIGAGHLAGMGRQSLRELRQALYPDSNVAQQPDLGIYGNATPGEVAESRRSDLEVDRWEQEGGSVVKDRLPKAEASRDVRGRDDKDLDKGLDKE